MKEIWIKYTGPNGAGDTLLWGIAPFKDDLIDGRRILNRIRLGRENPGCVEVLGPGLGGTETTFAYIPDSMTEEITSNGIHVPLDDEEIKRMGLKMWLSANAHIEVIEPSGE